MNVIHFVEGKTVVLVQFLNQIPSVDQVLKIKGRKAKVLSVNRVDENKIHVHVDFEKVVKKQPITKDTKKKRR